MRISRIGRYPADPLDPHTSVLLSTQQCWVPRRGDRQRDRRHGPI